ncbi:MAG: hypothetical protein KAS53_02620 [Candidatus Cloacimonetes bacterium]|nr:hypothetical protein [Candidatus Cloacimonadota bacterium]
MNKFTKSLLLGVIILFTFMACDENPSEHQTEDPTPPSFAEIFDIEFTIPDSTELANYVSEQVDYNGLMVTGYSLEQFVDMDSVNAYIDEDDFDGRKLFAVEIISSDEDGNWTPRENGYYDLSWANFITGYLLPDEKGRTYFSDENIPSGHNVKWAYYLRLYRKIDVVQDANITVFETGAFTPQEITYTKDGDSFTVNAIKLENFVSEYVSQEPEDYQYLFTAADGWVNDDSNNLFDWDTIQNSYWLPEQNKAVFLDANFDTIFKSVKVLEKIDLVEIQR